eukprot:UN06004
MYVIDLLNVKRYKEYMIPIGVVGMHAYEINGEGGLGDSVFALILISEQGGIYTWTIGTGLDKLMDLPSGNDWKNVITTALVYENPPLTKSEDPYHGENFSVFIITESNIMWT